MSPSLHFFPPLADTCLVMSETFLRKTYIDNNSTAQLEEGLHVNKVTDYRYYSLISDLAYDQ